MELESIALLDFDFLWWSLLLGVYIFSNLFTCNMKRIVLDIFVKEVVGSSE